MIIDSTMIFNLFIFSGIAIFNDILKFLINFYKKGARCMNGRLLIKWFKLRFQFFTIAVFLRICLHTVIFPHNPKRAADANGGIAA
ncbi:hypothetical protein SDC9_207996 [bioreactor metagenome]|uniref:Uncharacterized protein n=1 Tax=bioreactor metagenome TaxID=1076179 RepID=A0A645JAT9_9ZZZZ